MSGPARRDRTRPLELVGLSAAFAVFVGGMVMLFTRQWLLALEFAGATFIISLVVLAMLLLAVGPKLPAPEGDGHEPPPAEDDEGSAP